MSWWPILPFLLGFSVVFFHVWKNYWEEIKWVRATLEFKTLSVKRIDYFFHSESKRASSACVYFPFRLTISARSGGASAIHLLFHNNRNVDRHVIRNRKINLTHNTDNLHLPANIFTKRQTEEKLQQLSCDVDECK